MYLTSSPRVSRRSYTSTENPTAVGNVLEPSRIKEQALTRDIPFCVNNGLLFESEGEQSENGGRECTVTHPGESIGGRKRANLGRGIPSA